MTLRGWLGIKHQLSVCLSTYLSAYLSAYLSVCLSVSLSVCLPICLSICTYLVTYLSYWLGVLDNVWVTLIWLGIKSQLSIYKPTYLPTYMDLSTYLSIFLPIIYLPPYRPDITVMVDWALKINYLSIYLPTSLPTCLPVCLCLHNFINLSNLSTYIYLFPSLKRTTDVMFGGKQVLICGYGEVGTVWIWLWNSARITVMFAC